MEQLLFEGPFPLAASVPLLFEAAAAATILFEVQLLAASTHSWKVELLLQVAGPEEWVHYRRPPFQVVQIP